MVQEGSQGNRAVEMEEIKEIRLRQIFGRVLPDAFGAYADKWEGIWQRMSSKSREEDPDFLAYIKFVSAPNAAAQAERKIFSEWQAKDDVLLTSCFAILAATLYEGAKTLRREQEEEAHEEILDEEDFLEGLEKDQADVEGALADLLEHSELFGKQYTREDVNQWLGEYDREMREERKEGVRLSPEEVEEYKVVAHILSGHWEKQDRAALVDVMDEELFSLKEETVMTFIAALREEKGARAELVRRVKELLRLYQLRNLVQRE